MSSPCCRLADTRLLLISLVVAVCLVMPTGGWAASHAWRDIRSNPAPDMDSLAAAAEGGNPEAIYAFGMCRLLGWAARVNWVEAHRLFEKASSSRHPGALYQWARFMEHDPDLGHLAGADFDLPKAVELYTMAAGQGSAEASLRLADLYRRGESLAGIEPDDAKAAHYARVAARLLENQAKQGDGEAAAMLVDLVSRHDVGRKAELEKLRTAAVTLLEQQAREGSVHAAYTLGRFGRYLYPDEQEKALKALEQAGEAGHAESAFLLGERYRREMAFSAEAVEMAIAWLYRAAKRDHPMAAMRLADIYLAGRPGEDASRAVHWLRKAAGGGLVGAMGRLGEAYIQGTLVDRDDDEGIRWLEQAQAHGYVSEDARLLLAKAYRSAGRTDDLLRVLQTMRRLALTDEEKRQLDRRIAGVTGQPPTQPTLKPGQAVVNAGERQDWAGTVIQVNQDKGTVIVEVDVKRNDMVLPGVPDPSKPAKLRRRMEMPIDKVTASDRTSLELLLKSWR